MGQVGTFTMVNAEPTAPIPHFIRTHPTTHAQLAHHLASNAVQQRFALHARQVIWMEVDALWYATLLRMLTPTFNVHCVQVPVLNVTVKPNVLNANCLMF